MENYNICILGGNSFLGLNITQKLLEEGYYIRLFSKNKIHYSLKKNKNIEIIYGDFFNEKDLIHALTGMDICIHLICTIKPGKSLSYYRDVEENVCGTLRMIEIAHQCHVKKIIFASSGGTIYGEQGENTIIDENFTTNPICSYGITKLMIEKYLYIYTQKYNIPTISLRISNPYGPFYYSNIEQGIINVFLKNIYLKQPIKIWGDGSTIRDYIHVKDVANAFIKAITTNTKEQIFNIGTGVGTSINELITYIKKITEKQFIINYEEGRVCDVHSNILNIDRSKAILNWEPQIDLISGIKSTWLNMLKKDKG